VAGFFHSDEWGVKDVFGTNWAPDEQVEELLQGFADDELDLVELELAAARGALAAALETNAARDAPPPPEFELWAPHFHDAYPPAADEPVVAPELDDAPYAGRQELVRAGGELLDHPFFLSWGFDPQEAALGLMLLAPPASGRWTDKQYRPLIGSFATPLVLNRLRRRLRRQAWLLEQAGHTRERDLALATAASLADTAPAKLVKHPFLRGMVNVTLGHLAGAIYGGDPWGTR
jgi:hypothetical protein